MKNAIIKPTKNSNDQKLKMDTFKKTNSAQGLRDLFIDELKDIYWAEKELTTALPKMIKSAASKTLVDALQGHLNETKEQISRLERVFSSVGEKVEAKKCEAIVGLIKEAEEIMDETEKGVVRDAGIILGGQKIEHYEIATYGTLLSFAKILGEDKAAELLEETLNEEREADDILSEIAESSVNLEAADKDNAYSFA